ncbi:hypothetical protein MIND_00120200 [Mycena indigotica]|uniref:F-box domain-containing protein n=1 Tax=Mycena indigotica TaxID=2126181 RepID=A0A8H6TC28_9AGAR|nr:uncharacterized protein MIND_00120200 [Mycena indigotica]KAF7316025.1 hypothetical protein MIND_00120200 [Mycena indigotica]
MAPGPALPVVLPGPVELVLAIAGYAPPPSLATLSRANSLFRAIAEECLYPRVVLDQHNFTQGFCWCRTMMASTRLALKVHSLVFDLHVMLESDATKALLAEELVRALRVCRDLTRLEVGYNFCDIPSTLGEFLGGGCPLRLTHLHLNSWEHITDLDAVWIEQAEITSLVIPCYEEHPDLGAVNLLPLTHIYAPLRAILPSDKTSWRLVHAVVSTIIPEEDEDPALPSFVSLGSYAATLTVLAVETHGPPGLTIYALLCLIADSLPNLTTLSYDETMGDGEERADGAI